MNARPILMSAPMVRALLAGSKTQTRRIIKDYTWYGCLTGDCPHQLQGECDKAMQDLCPYGQPGAMLWVRETWAVDAPLEQARSEHEDALSGLGHGPYYRADKEHENSGLTWRPSIHMPRWASRLTLELTNVWAQELKSINNNDALAEGTPDIRTMENNYDMRECYRVLWESINGAGSWEKNPWVWVLTFKVHQKNINDFKARAA